MEERKKGGGKYYSHAWYRQKAHWEKINMLYYIRIVQPNKELAELEIIGERSEASEYLFSFKLKNWILAKKKRERNWAEIDEYSQIRRYGSRRR